MVVLTAVMLVILLCLVPLRVALDFKFDLTGKGLDVAISLLWMPVFREKFTLQGGNLVCRGTVDSNLNILTLDSKPGVNLVKALVFDSVSITFAPNYSKVGPSAMVGLEAFCGAFTAVCCGITHCRVHTDTRFSVANAIFGEVVVSVSLAEILIVLVREKIRIWTNK